MKIQTTVDKNGRFRVEPIYDLLKSDFAQALYKCSEHLLGQAIGYTPIRERTLRSSGNVVFNGKEVATEANRPKNLSKDLTESSQVHRLEFKVGFHTPYALYVHEAKYRLGARSKKAAEKKGKNFGKVGPKYLTRAFSDNLQRYLGFLKRWSQTGNGTANAGKVKRV